MEAYNLSAWHQASIMASRANDTKVNATKKCCLPLPMAARHYQTKKQKSPQLHGPRRHLLPTDTSQCQTQYHSHSMVAGGLLETS